MGKSEKQHVSETAAPKILVVFQEEHGNHHSHMIYQKTSMLVNKLSHYRPTTGAHLKKKQPKHQDPQQLNFDL